MRQSTSALRDYLDGKNGNRQIKVKLVYPGGDEIRTVQTLDYDCSFGNSLALGNTVSANIRVTCETPAFDVSEREFTLFFGAKLPGDTDETWTQIGIFKTIPKSTESRMGFTTFTAYDRMYINTNKQYNATCNFPCSLQDILNDVCGQAGFSPVPAITANPTVENDMFSEYSVRDVIGYIASYQGKNAYVDCEGKLTLKWFTTCNYTADSKKANIPFADEKDTTVQILVCSTGDENIQVGTGKADTELLSFNNPIMTEERLEEIKNAIAGFTYRRLDAEIPLGSYLIESGDIISIKYENEAFDFEYTVPAMTVSYHYDGGLSCKVTSYGVPDGVTKSISAKKFIDHYKLNELQEEIVRNTDAITGASGGYVRINFGDDGKTAEIMILDNPDPEKAKYVWRWNGAGLGHSHQGYNGPFDDVAITADGHINANYITAGKLSGIVIKTIPPDVTDRSYVQLEEGGMVFYTSNNNLVGGIVEVLESGTEDSAGVALIADNNRWFSFGHYVKPNDPSAGWGPDFAYRPTAAEPFQFHKGIIMDNNSAHIIVPNHVTGQGTFDVGTDLHRIYEKLSALEELVGQMFTFITSN